MTDELELKDSVEPISMHEPNNSTDEDVLPKTTVSKIVERERLKAYEKGRQEAMTEMQNTMQAQEAPQIQQHINMPQGNMGGMQALSQADIEQLIMQKAPEALMQQVNQLKTENMVNNFVSKMQAGEQKFPGLEAKLNKLNYNDPRMHQLIELANGFDNTADIMNELVDNPNKMIQVLSGISEQPFLSQQTLMSLSNSIKQNDAAKAEVSEARNPMSQLKPSTITGVGQDSGMSTSDFRKMFARR